MRECKCGALVSDDFHRVLSDRFGVLHTCQSCGLMEGNVYVPSD